MNMTPAVQATAGGGHSMVYDSTYDQVILFGEPNNDKTWIYKITEKYFQQGIFDSIITTFDDLYKISGEITWNPIDQPSETSLQVQVGFSNSPYEEDFIYTALYNDGFTFQ